MEETKKLSLDARVRAIGTSGKAKGMPNKFNLPQNKENRMLHIDICKKLMELSDKHNHYPIGYLVYFAVGKNAHRTHIFECGYKTINEEKAETIFKMLDIFAKHHQNEKLARNANVAHIMCRYYDEHKGNIDFEKFTESVTACTPSPKIDEFNRVGKCPWYKKEKVD